MATMKELEAAADAAAHERANALTTHDKLAIPIADRLADCIRAELGYEVDTPGFSRLVTGPMQPREKKITEHLLRGDDENTYLFGVAAQSGVLGSVEIQIALEPISAITDGRRGQGWDLRYNSKQVSVLSGDAPSDDAIRDAARAITERMKAEYRRGKRG